MLVFYEERLAFLAVPKTGSTAYHSALKDRADLVVTGPPALKHAPVRRYDRFFQNIFRKMYDIDMEIMAVVREPIDWLGSWYKFRSRDERIGHPHSTRDMSFDDYVQAYMKSPRPEYADVGSQSQFFRTRSNGRGADHVFKYENQDKILDFLENRLDMKIALQRENVSPTRDLALSAETEQKFRKRHALEFECHEKAQ
ncbi:MULTISPECIES: sulfotransferase family 2 domain-containing protein [unclassified Ruegeria]|uniref:sulfotransferase family 2 domain-containing protein n=1 Tax=unclassified Ruegeria TaxID=2625375 RepID=UPI001ADC9A0F|nr:MULTISPECIES: sulfotransferase family 2 domain-containing protein [unclassified Ruegeria]MBO9410687.1 gamma-glutamyl kinase [Ruegeria sp. R8_1]MBO9414094.1 gamma-glutamyl kinase [Ruegeria sp. R8_2]